MGKAFALDWGAIFQAAQARGLDMDLIGELVPPLEHIILRALDSDPDDAPDEWDAE